MKRFAILAFVTLMISAPSMAYSAESLNMGHGYGGRYVGAMLNGKRTGFGTVTYPYGCKYVGEWLNNKYNGHGVYTDGDNKWDSNFVNGHLEGIGTYTHLKSIGRYLAGERFTGTWHNGTKIEGIRTMPNGTRWHEIYDQQRNQIEKKRL